LRLITTIYRDFESYKAHFFNPPKPNPTPRKIHTSNPASSQNFGGSPHFSPPIPHIKPKALIFSHEHKPAKQEMDDGDPAGNRLAATFFPAFSAKTQWPSAIQPQRTELGHQPVLRHQ
jgi:hypothetical protein